jgi:predicted nuclease of predicted toxin-antitoxin system
MKFLIDMNLSPRWVEILQSEGWDSVHWSEIGRPDATDSELMEWAREHGRVVLTHDLDFGAMLAATQATSPSVAQIRAQDVRPESLAGNSTFDAARISRFEVTRVAVPRRWRSFHGLGAGFFCVRSSDSAQLSSYAVLHSRVVASGVWGEAGRSRRPRQWRVSGAGSTRFHQTEMVRPAVGAATTERWSVRGPGVRLHRLPLKLQKPHQTG